MAKSDSLQLAVSAALAPYLIFRAFGAWVALLTTFGAVSFLLRASGGLHPRRVDPHAVTRSGPLFVAEWLFTTAKCRLVKACNSAGVVLSRERVYALCSYTNLANQVVEEVSVRESSAWVARHISPAAWCSLYSPAALASGAPVADARLRASRRNRLRLCNPAKAELGAFTARLFRAAKTRIFVSTCYLHNYATLWELLHVLEERARDGLEVRILLDNTTVDMHLCTGGQTSDKSVTKSFPQTVHWLQTKLHEAGARTVFWTDACRGLPYRTKWHRKFLVVDGHTAVVGGSNLVSVPLSTDCDAIVQGDAARELDEEFARLWRDMEPPDASIASVSASEPPLLRGDGGGDDGEPLGPPAEGFDFFPWTCDAALTAVVASSVGTSGVDPILAQALRLIGGAKKTVRIAMGFAAPARPIIDAISAALARGVRVTFTGNSYTSMDLKGPQLDQSRALVALLQRCPGCAVYLTHGTQFLHGKTVLVDGEVALFGSWNMWPRSHFYESELDLCVWDGALARRMEESYDSIRAEFCERMSSWEDVAVGPGCAISCTWGVPLW